jgi:hypothetical protein
MGKILRGVFFDKTQHKKVFNSIKKVQTQHKKGVQQH